MKRHALLNSAAPRPATIEAMRLTIDMPGDGRGGIFGGMTCTAAPETPAPTLADFNRWFREWGL